MDTLYAMKMAAAYNNMTGANITHWEVEEIGVKEYDAILATIDIWGIN